MEIHYKLILDDSKITLFFKKFEMLNILLTNLTRVYKNSEKVLKVTSLSIFFNLLNNL